ncbi:GAF domain-containing protein [Bradyrhizobium diazoefficiens]|uniref:GAF domain-containing protein n=1 Tax=Bradyrhizobium diazoefficiens TaxID=1355477 RepID=UPI00190C13E3|nr:GAF domain-containing protein [Bradyrhizobium diazoefficiens]QQO16754.1 GAF domain-containing protein [Bradyrhizobium diazoefficiens]
MIAFDDLRDFLGSLTRATSEGAAFSALEKRSARLHNHVLFTCLRFDYRDQVMLRLYSNREEVSPIGGQKPLPSGPWADRLIQEGRSYIGRSRQDLKEVFFDYEPLWAIGCESVMNIPIRWKSHTVGSINILGRASQYDDVSAEHFAPYAQLAVPLFLDTRGPCDARL